MGYGDMAEWPNTRYVSKLHIRRACDASLQRMKTDYIDLYQMHHIYRAAPWEEVWEAFEVLQAQGKILYVGSSNFAAWNIAQANERAAKRNNLGLVSEQSKYSLIQRDIELEVAPACESYGVGIIPWSPLGGGVLAGVMKGQGGERRYGDWTKHIIETRGDKLQAWEDFCAELGEEPADVALAWTISKKYVTAPIIGPRTSEQLKGSLRALEIELTEEHHATIDAIFPPFKTAPEHYAW
jgi:aryl-alcohol dehydrogenase-like predicted oxidoreductase